MIERVFSEHKDFIPKPVYQDVVETVISQLSEDQDAKFAEVSFVIMNDDEHTALNIKYLDRDYSTDILTFDMSDTDEIAGDVYINWEVCRTNAKEYGVSDEQELYRLFIHGLLHLVGFDDHTDDEKAEMRGQEDRYLQLLEDKSFM